MSGKPGLTTSYKQRHWPWNTALVGIFSVLQLAFPPGAMVVAGEMSNDCKNGRLQALAARIENAGGKVVFKGNRIEELHLDGVRECDELLASVPDSTGIVLVDLSNSDVSDQIADILPAFRDCRSLGLYNTRITSKALSNITALPELRSLSIGLTTVGDDALRSIGRLEHLSGLDASSTEVTDVGIAELAALEGLTWLWLGGSQLTDLGAETIAGLRELEELVVPGTEIGDDGVALVAALPRLRRLDISATAATAKCCKALQTCPALAHLMCTFPLRRDEIKELAEMPRIKDVELNGKMIQPSDLMPFAQSASLKKIHVTHVDIEAGDERWRTLARELAPIDIFAYGIKVEELLGPQ